MKKLSLITLTDIVSFLIGASLTFQSVDYSQQVDPCEKYKRIWQGDGMNEEDQLVVVTDLDYVRLDFRGGSTWGERASTREKGVQRGVHLEKLGCENPNFRWYNEDYSKVVATTADEERWMISLFYKEEERYCFVGGSLHFKQSLEDGCLAEEQRSPSLYSVREDFDPSRECFTGKDATILVGIIRSEE